MVNEPLRTLQHTVLDLPAVETSLVGRTSDLAVARELLAAHRAVEILGAPGVGKTRLAIALAREVAAEFDDVVWVALQHIDDATRLAAHVARVMGLAASLMRHSDLLDALSDRGRRMLVVLDNAEHVLAEIRRLVRALHELPDVSLIVTSRTVVDGLAAVRLAGLDDDAALTLLEQFRGEPTLPAERGDLAQLMKSTGGLPLAIRLAAARLDVLSPRQLVEHTTPDTALADAVRTSWDRLGGRERAVMVALSAFRGGGEPDRLAGVARMPFDEVVAVLRELRHRSLVEQDSSHGRRRFWMLPAVSEFVSREMDPAPARSAHAECYAAFAREATLAVRTMTDAEWSNRLATERPNLAAAARWADDTGAYDHAADLVVALAVAARLSGFADDVMVIGAGIWAHRDEIGVPAFFDEYGHMLIDNARLELAQEVFDYLAARAETPLERVYAGRGLGRLAYRRGQMEAGLVHVAAALDLAHEVDNFEVAATKAMLAMLQGQLAGGGSDELLSAASTMFTELGALHDQANCDHLLAWHWWSHDRPDSVRLFAQRALAGAEQTGDVRLALESQWLYGAAELEIGELPEAERVLLDLIEAGRRIGSPEQVGTTAALLVHLYLELGDTESAREMLRVETRHSAACAEPVVRFMSAVLEADVLAHEGDLEAGAAAYDAAAARPIRHWDAALFVTTQCNRAVVHALRGAEREAQAALAAARDMAATLDRAGLRLRCDLVSSATTRFATDASDAGCRLEPLVALRLGRTGLDWPGSQPRLMAKLIERHLGQWEHLYQDVRSASDGWLVAADGSWLRTPDAEWVSLASRARLAAMLACLAATPESSVEHLVETVWSGERMTEDSAKNRVRATISMLRSEGLGDAVLHDGRAYRLDRARVRVWAK